MLNVIASDTMLEQMGRYHLTESHWYLPLIGVEPVKQGRGMELHS